MSPESDGPSDVMGKVTRVDEKIARYFYSRRERGTFDKCTVVLMVFMFTVTWALALSACDEILTS